MDCLRCVTKKVNQIARKHTRGRFAVCAIHGIDEPDEPLRHGFKGLGYRLGTTQPLMIHWLRRIQCCTAPASIQQVMTEEMAYQLAKVARLRQILPEHLGKGLPIHGRTLR